MAAQHPFFVYGAFDSPETASKASGGTVHELEGHEGNAFVLTDNQGYRLIYAKASYQNYAKIGSAIDGESFAKSGYNVDHVCSKAEQLRHGDDYVLLARVKAEVNKSAGYLERPDHHKKLPTSHGQKRAKVAKLSRNFNDKSVAPHPDGGRATPLTELQVEKLKSRMKADYDPKSKSNAAHSGPLTSDEVQQSLMISDPKRQKKIESLMGRKIADHQRESAWDRQRRELPNVPTTYFKNK